MVIGNSENPNVEIRIDELRENPTHSEKTLYWVEPVERLQMKCGLWNFAYKYQFSTKIYSVPNPYACSAKVDKLQANAIYGGWRYRDRGETTETIRLSVAWWRNCIIFMA